MQSFLNIARAKRLDRVAAAYAVAGWILVQGASIVLPTFGTYGTDFGGDFYRVWANAFDFAAATCKIATAVVPGDLGQIGRGWASRAELDAWRTAFSFAVMLDGNVLQSGFGPALSLTTHSDGTITAG